jgi:hypothetical protein
MNKTLEAPGKERIKAKAAPNEKSPA